MDIEQLIAEYGTYTYLIAFIWTFLEGETARWTFREAEEAVGLPPETDLAGEDPEGVIRRRAHP